MLAVIETDKASFDLESTAAGKVLALFWEADDDVPVLANVAVVGQDGEDVEEFRPEGQGGASSEAAAPVEAPSASPVAAQPSAGNASEVPAASAGTIAASSGVSRARRLAIKHGLDPESVQGSGPDGRVIERDIQAALDGRPRL